MVRGQWTLFLENTAEVEILLRDAFAASQNTLEKNENLMELYAIVETVESVMSAVRLKSPLGARQHSSPAMVTIKLVILASG